MKIADDKKILFVSWCAKDVLNDTMTMDESTELAYRRLIDLILSTNDNLPDNDAMLQSATRAGKKWKSIKFALIEQYEKIYVENGCIHIRECDKKLEDSARNIEQKSYAGKVSSEKRKALKNIDTTSTAVDTAVSTAVPTNHQPSTINEVINIKHPSATAARVEKQGLQARDHARDSVSHANARAGYSVMEYLNADDEQAARAAAPGWDLSRLAAIFDTGLRDGSRQWPRNPQKPGAYFIGFCRNYTKGKRP